MLQHFGLTETQAKAYISLVKRGALTAKELTLKIKESRTNTYMVLDKLVDMGLILKSQNQKVLRFYAASPESGSFRGLKVSPKCMKTGS